MNRKDYSALTLRTRNGNELELLPAMGGRINGLRFVIDNEIHDVIAGCADQQALLDDVGFRGIPIFPFVNRLDQGRYMHLGHTYQFDVNEPERDNALHGFLQHLAPVITVSENPQSSECQMRYHYTGDNPGYPFAADIDFSFILNDSDMADNGSLELRISVINKHDEPIPVGIGWHPYFTFGHSIEDVKLQLPLVQKMDVNERMLPTGVQHEYNAFATLTPIDQTDLDDCFAIQAIGEQSIATTTLWSEKQNVGLAVWQKIGNRGLNFLQLYIPPDRHSIAIEPVSCGVNAFNTGDGLIMLEPGQSISAFMGVRPLTSIEQSA